MKWFSKKVNSFCYKHPRFGIPNLMLYVVIANAVIWLLSYISTTSILLDFLAFSPSRILKGELWRLITFIFIPDSSGLLALIFFYFYYFIGRTLEYHWGTARFNIYFFSGVLLNIIYGFILYIITGLDFNLNAHYLYLSTFFSFATLFPNMRVMLFFFIPIKIKWLAIVDAVVFLLAILGLPFPLNLLPVIALLNYLLFCGDELFNTVRPRSREKRKAANNFKREIHRINYEQRTKSYTRRCEVCGRTDTDHPDLEFRYCSRCAGYHCFCIDHINAHQHFSE